jgi:hypothetical protein
VEDAFEMLTCASVFFKQIGLHFIASRRQVAEYRT